MVVASADAVVDEDAVVVSFGDAAFADGAVLGAGRLEEAAGRAVRAWVEEGEVVGVARHLGDVVLWGDEAGVGEGGQVEEDIGEQDGDAAGYFVESGELWPGGG